MFKQLSRFKLTKKKTVYSCTCIICTFLNENIKFSTKIESDFVVIESVGLLNINCFNLT